MDAMLRWNTETASAFAWRLGRIRSEINACADQLPMLVAQVETLDMERQFIQRLADELLFYLRKLRQLETEMLCCQNRLNRANDTFSLLEYRLVKDVLIPLELSDDRDETALDAGLRQPSRAERFAPVTNRMPCPSLPNGALRESDPPAVQLIGMTEGIRFVALDSPIRLVEP